ncbi:MAG: DMT family transporter [Candidatus Hodarchaeales archaeon]
MSVTAKKTSYMLMVLTTLTWGISWPVTKKLVEIAPPMTLGFFRFLIGLLCFVILMLVLRTPISLSKDSLKSYFLLGLTGIFGYGILFLIGIKFTTAAQGAIIAGVNPAGISLIAHFMHGEKLDRKWKYWGFPISFAGVIFVIGVQSLIDFQLEHLIGNLIILAAMGVWGIYSNLGRKFMERMSSLEATTGAVFVGMMLFGAGAVTEGFGSLEMLVNPDFWLGILIVGVIVTFCGFFLYFMAVKNIGATSAGIFINLVPVFGTVFSALILHETIYWTFIVGLLMIISGIVLINIPVKGDVQDSK